MSIISVYLQRVSPIFWDASPLPVLEFEHERIICSDGRVDGQQGQTSDQVDLVHWIVRLRFGWIFRQVIEFLPVSPFNFSFAMIITHLMTMIVMIRRE
jgi:hypothetical protein